MAEAEKLYIRALKGYKKALGADYPKTLRTANNLCIVKRTPDTIEYDTIPSVPDGAISVECLN